MLWFKIFTSCWQVTKRDVGSYCSSECHPPAISEQRNGGNRNIWKLSGVHSCGISLDFIPFSCAELQPALLQQRSSSLWLVPNCKWSSHIVQKPHWRYECSIKQKARVPPGSLPYVSALFFEFALLQYNGDTPCCGCDNISPLWLKNSKSSSRPEKNMTFSAVRIIYNVIYH